MVAGAVLILALLSAFYIRRRRHRQRESRTDPIAPFPRAARPDLWQKGTEAGALDVITALEPPRPYAGKRPGPASVPPSTDPETIAGAVASSSNLSTVNQPPPTQGPRQGSVPAPEERQAVVSAVSVDRIIEILAERLHTTAQPTVRDEAPPRYEA